MQIVFILSFVYSFIPGVRGYSQSVDSVVITPVVITPAVGVKMLKRTVVINAPPEEVFSFMDDIANTGMHMTESNAPMMGGKLVVEWLTDHKTGLGARYRWRGKVIGMKMDFTVEVTKWIEGKEKIWESVGEAKMIILSWYRLHLVLTPLEGGITRAELSIYYTKPERKFLAFLLARRYSIWCVKSMLKDTKKHFRKNA